MPRGRVVRRSSGGFRRSPGRLTEWFSSSFVDVESPLAANSGVILASLTATGLAKRPFTVTRTIGNLWVASDQNAAIEFPSGAVGCMVVSEKASTLGFTAVPDPVTESSSDEWLMYEDWAVEGSTSTNVGRPVTRISFDSRAQRKVQDGEDIVFVLANASATDGIFYHFRFRQLMKLS